MLPFFFWRGYCKGGVLANAPPRQPKHRYCMRRRACCNRRSSPWLLAAGRAPVHDHRNKIFATTMLFFCWNRPMFLLPPTHLKSATGDFLLEPANHFATTVLSFVTTSVL